ncbi:MULTISPECIES: flavin reductase [Pseudomonas]|uniref:Flavin reductase n=1 Tax=Pseudomonas piscis TaxID=2614538 RepID=A0A7X1PQQ7_9PSED|nr:MULTISPECIES: flavin reductase [Pseudomonas]MQA56681.1 flavin reductase [Pseudomonas piscis]
MREAEPVSAVSLYRALANLASGVTAITGLAAARFVPVSLLARYP